MSTIFLSNSTVNYRFTCDNCSYSVRIFEIIAHDFSDQEWRMSEPFFPFGSMFLRGTKGQHFNEEKQEPKLNRRKNLVIVLNRYESLNQCLPHEDLSK